MGDIGKRVEHIELEPLEIQTAPSTEPAPTVPEQEPVPA